MKKIFLTLFLLISVLISSAQSIHSFAEKSVLANGKFVKIRLVQSGIYRLTYDDLRSMGVNPAQVRIFGYGGNMLEQNFLMPIIDDLPEVTIYDSGSYILFYANGTDKWTYNNSLGLFTHQPNTYSSYAYYFVTSDAGTGRKIETAQPIVIPQDAVINNIETFTDYQIYKKEIRSLASVGKTLYGESFDNSNTFNIDFSSPNPAGTIVAMLDVVAHGSISSSFTLSLEDRQYNVSIPSVTNNYARGANGRGIYTFSSSNNNLNFKLTYNRSGSSLGYLNALTINAIRQLRMNGAAMQFQNLDNLGSNIFKKYRLSNTSENIRIWNITDTENIKQMPAEHAGGAMTFTDSAIQLQKYIAVDLSKNSQFPKPEVVGNVDNQNLHSLSAIDYVMITHSDFMQQAERLAQTHRETSNMRVAVVTTEQVYNEFSSGAPDATAYRRFLKMLYHKATNENDKPKYLLLFGGGSYDNRNLISGSGVNHILTYQSDNSLVITSGFVTDDYFALLDDNEGIETTSGLPGNLDVGVGRFPVKNKEEAENVVNKTINYIKNTEKGIWKNQLCFLADDGDGVTHMRDADDISNMIQQNSPAYQINKIYLDAYQRETSASGYIYPAVRTNLFDQLKKGLFFLNYSGHAGQSGWTAEQVIISKDIDELTNKRLPLWVAVTCDFLMFDNGTVSGGERVLLNPNGGGIGIVAASRPVYSGQNKVFNSYFCQNMFKKDADGKHYRLGDLTRIAKNSIGTEINKLCYALIGDPALMLDYPSEYEIKTNSINGQLTTGNDTIKALSTTTLTGSITNRNGEIAENFNGTINIVIYDKQQQITTLDNQKQGVFFNFNAWNNILFSGKTSVVKGKYSITFMLPMDMKKNYGNGRINYYANDTITNAEAQGYFEDFIVGGIEEVVSEDNEGPAIELFLNSFEFSNGDKVNENPVLIATLEDVNGINVVGSGIGHDLLMIIDDDPSKNIVLNDFYVADQGSFQRGTLRYKLPELADGKHTLSLRAWDLLNNSTTVKIEFETKKGLTPNIFSVYNYPNPVRKNDHTRIIVSHDRPETILNTTVDIFDLSGRLVRTFNQTNADDIIWDMTSGNGERIRGGMYIYRVTIQTTTSDKYSKSNKILVIE